MQVYLKLCFSTACCLSAVIHNWSGHNLCLLCTPFGNDATRPLRGPS